MVNIEIDNYILWKQKKKCIKICKIKLGVHDSSYIITNRKYKLSDILNNINCNGNVDPSNEQSKGKRKIWIKSIIWSCPKNPICVPTISPNFGLLELNSCCFLFLASKKQKTLFVSQTLSRLFGTICPYPLLHFFC